MSDISHHTEYRDLGNLSSVEPPYRRAMACDDCRVRWDGCADAFECPECGQGELPGFQLKDLWQDRDAPRRPNRKNRE